jgi:hypothetical protein
MPSQKFYQSHELIFIQGEPDNYIYRLLEGRVAAYISLKSHILIDIFSPGNIFGMGPFKDGINIFTSEAVGDIKLEIIDFEKEKEYFFEKGYVVTVLQLVNRINDKLNEGGIKTEMDLIPFFRKAEFIDEAFFGRFFPFNLVRKAVEYLEANKEIERKEKGKYIFIKGYR